jgi:hypothetical protein
MRSLRWDYSGVFSTEEVEAIRKLALDRDDSISLVAGYILEKIETKK